MYYCPRCGQQMRGNFCGNCGFSFMQNDKQGLSIASMVLGIVAAFWGFIVLIQVGDLEQTLIDANLKDVGEYIAFLLGFNLFSLVCGILGLIFGLNSKKNKKAIAGIITSLFALFSFIVCITVAIVTNV